MNKQFLTLALLMSTLASAQVRVEVTGTMTALTSENTLTTRTISHTEIQFDKEGDSTRVTGFGGEINYTLVKSDTETVTIALDISRTTEEGEVELIAQPVITSEWEKEGVITMANDAGESLELTITAHNTTDITNTTDLD